MTIAYFIVFVVAMLGNAFVIFVVYRHPKLKTTFNMFIVNMAAADILDAVTAVPYSIAYLHQGGKWFPGRFALFLCKLVPYLAFLSIGASVLTLTVISFDRYLAIIYTLRRPLSPRLTVVAIVSTWIISSAVFGTELYKFQLYDTPAGIICAPRWVPDLVESHKITLYEMVVRFFLLYAIPLLAMAFLYSRIILHLWKRKAPGEHIDKNHKRVQRQKRKVITMLLTIVTIFAICWLPAHINHFILTFDYDTYRCLPASVVLTFYFLTHANSAINPCLYLIFNESFREGFKHQVYHRLSRGPFSASDRMSTTRQEAFSGSIFAVSSTRLEGRKKDDDMNDTRV